jgi:hypothetical protein
MSVSFLIYNEIDNAIISASSENYTFPLSNLQDDRRTKVFRSNSNSDSVLIDLGTFREIDSFFIVDHPMNGFSLTSLTLELNSVNNWVSPPVSIPITLDYKHGVGSYFFTAPVTYRYARLVMTSTSGYCELSKVFLGLKNNYANSDFSYPLNFNENNLAVITKNRYGQKFIDEINTQKSLKAKIDYVPKEDIDDMLDWLEYVSITRPFFISFCEDAQFSNEPNRLNGYYYLASEPNIQLSTGNFWSFDINLEEAL